MLYPSEETYVDFLAINQKVRLKELSLEAASEAEDAACLNAIRSLLKSDRAIFDKVMAAALLLIDL
jgi:hypothetical protein